MKVFRDIAPKTITIIDDSVFYGITRYSINDISKLKTKENLPPSVIVKILDAYTGKSTEEEIREFATDEDFAVRYAIAKSGHALGIMLFDEYSMIREEVAKHGYGLDTLIKDRVAGVRIAVAKQGYGLDKLVNDPRPEVRIAVAEQHYGLNTLARDPDKYVRQVAKHKLAEIKVIG
jgi:HEAT repeat protein